MQLRLRDGKSRKAQTPRDDFQSAGLPVSQGHTSKCRQSLNGRSFRDRTVVMQTYDRVLKRVDAFARRSKPRDLRTLYETFGEFRDILRELQKIIRADLNKTIGKRQSTKVKEGPGRPNLLV